MSKTTVTNQIHTKALEIFKIYNSVVRTPVNWQEERERLKASPQNRANWQYAVPESIQQKERDIKQLYEQFTKATTRSASNLYERFLPDVAKATVDTAVIKCEILEKLSVGKLEQTRETRGRFYALDFDYSTIERDFEKTSKVASIRKVGEALGSQDTDAEDAREIVRTSIARVRSQIENVTPLLPNYRDKMLTAFTAKVEIVDDPSFSMRCITDPDTLATKVLLNKRRRYSTALLELAYLHEFCGHALEMAIFDKTLVKLGILPQIYSYAGVSSPSIFDVKAEVFADRIVAPFMNQNEMRFVRYRRDVWLICRAMADYLYHLKGATIKEVMSVYEAVGLSDFAFDEAAMASIFIDGYQGMYLFANREIERLQRESFLADNEMLMLLLYMGKIPIDRFNQFRHQFRLDCLDISSIDCYTKNQSKRPT